MQDRLAEIEATTPTKADIHAEMLSAIEGLKLPSAAQFERLQRIPTALITAAQLFQLQLYEVSEPLKKEVNLLDGELATALESARKLSAENKTLEKERDDFEKALARIKTEDRRVSRLADVELQLKVATGELEHATRMVEELESRCKVAEEERDLHVADVTTYRQQSELLRMDKDHLTLAHKDATVTVSHLKDQLTAQQKTIATLSQSREESYERLLKSKEEQSAQFEHKLHEQVQSIRERNRDEIDELQRNTKAMLEAENRACRFARDAAVQAQQQLERELKSKAAQYDELLQSTNEHKSSANNRITTIDADIKMKCFELERLQLLFDESQANLTEANLTSQKQCSKVELLTREYYELKASVQNPPLINRESAREH